MSTFSEIFQVKKQIPAQVLADILPWGILSLLHNSGLETKLIDTIIKNNRDIIPYTDDEIRNKTRYLISPDRAPARYSLSGDDIVVEIPLLLFIGASNFKENDYIEIYFIIKKIIDKKAQNKFRDLLQYKIENKDRRTTSEFNLQTDINKVCDKFLVDFLSQVKKNEILIDNVYNNVNKTRYLEFFPRTSLQKAFDIKD